MLRRRQTTDLTARSARTAIRDLICVLRDILDGERIEPCSSQGVMGLVAHREQIDKIFRSPGESETRG